MSLPLDLDGPVRVSVRLARVLPQAVDAALVVAGVPVDRFTARGGAILERGGRIELPGFTPAVADLSASGADDQGRSLRLDWLRFDLEEGARARLHGLAGLRPALLGLVLFLALRGAGLGPSASAGLVAPWIVAGVLLLRTDPWLAHRLLTRLPEFLAVVCLVLLGACRLLVRRGLLVAGDARWIVAVSSFAFVLRGGVLNHPDYWYPDLYSHTSLVAVVRDAGLGFFADPAGQIERWGIGVHQVFGESLAVPYTPTFHLPFALLPIDLENVPTLMRLVATALCSVPILMVAVLARRFGTSPACVVLLALFPAYGVRLVLALLPALFGHAVDSVFLAWFAHRLARLVEPRVALAGAGLVAASCLAYVSALVILPAFLAAAALVLAFQGPQRRRLALGVLGIGAAGGVLALLLYYRSFAPFLIATLAHLGSGGAGSAHPALPFLPTLLTRLVTFYPPLVTLLAVLGIFRLVRHSEDGRAVLGAWALSYLGLLACRAAFPEVFGHVHEELFAAPLFCLGAGDTLGRMSRGPAVLRLAAAAAVLLVAYQGLMAQWASFTEQFGYAL